MVPASELTEVILTNLAALNLQPNTAAQILFRPVRPMAKIASPVHEPFEHVVDIGANPIDAADEI